MLTIAIVLVGLTLVNQLPQKMNWFWRVDLTEDNRYSINRSTKKLLKELDDVVYVEVYLEGSLPAGFRRLRNAIDETLNQFKLYSGVNLQYRFIDPETAESDRARNEFFRELGLKGIQPTNVFSTEDGKRVQKLIFPGAIVSYAGNEKGVMFLKGNRTASAQERLNQSIEGVEYELVSAIHQLSSQGRKRVGITTGHGELDSLEIAGLTNILLQQYNVASINLNKVASLSGYDAVIVPKPTKPFSKQDQFKLDQYVMGGGKMLYFLDALHVDMDSAGGEGTFAFPYDLELQDMLFRYGVRLNHDLIQDLNSGAYPVVTGNFGDQPQISFLPWPFHPVATTFSDALPVKNMDAVSLRFVGTIDTVKSEGIKKTPIIYTSPYTKVLKAPVKIAFNDFRNPPVPETFSGGPKPVAYLLEGTFTSAFKNRILPEGVQKAQFLEESVHTKLFICSDGDFVRNEIEVESGTPLELGYEQFSKTTYANQDLIMNMLAYMLDEQGIIDAKAKQIALRPLDKIKVEQERVKWQLMNILVPILVVVLMGVIKSVIRKAKYTNF